jgi:hypothetical protein
MKHSTILIAILITFSLNSFGFDLMNTVKNKAETAFNYVSGKVNKDNVQNLAASIAVSAQSKGIQLGANLDIAKQMLYQNGSNALNYLKAVNYKSVAAKAGVISGLALMQYAFCEKASFNRVQTFQDLMSKHISRRTLAVTNHPGGVLKAKFVFNVLDESKAQNQALEAEKVNNRNSLLLGLSGAALTAAGYLYCK